MLERPNINDEDIIAHIIDHYGLRAARLSFLPIGADVNTAVYRLESPDAHFFLKLRQGTFEEITVTVPLFLKSLGLVNIIAPLQTKGGGWWAHLDQYTSVLYPFIEGQDGYKVQLKDSQWQEFGAALNQIHTANVPEELKALIPTETYNSYWREMVKDFQELIEQRTFTDPVAVSLAAFMQAQREVIKQLVDLAGNLALTLQDEPPESVLCHCDLHAGNLFIDPQGALFIVDWDNPKLAPKEHDLMHISGSTTWNDPKAAELFYRGYGPVEVNRTALAYYHCERIIMDIAAYGQQLLLSDEGGADRESSLGYFKSNFLPGHEIEIAFRTARNEYEP